MTASYEYLTKYGARCVTTVTVTGPREIEVNERGTAGGLTCVWRFRDIDETKAAFLRTKHGEMDLLDIRDTYGYPAARARARRHERSANE